LAQEEEIQRLIASFQTQDLQGNAVAQLEVLVRTAVFKSANELVGWLLQQAADRADGVYQAKPGEVRKGRETLAVQGIFGRLLLQRDYYHHAGEHAGHYPAEAALGLEGSYTPALAKLICLEGADEPTYLKAERHLEQTGGIAVSARQIQRVVQRVGGDAQTWQERRDSPTMRRPALGGGGGAGIGLFCAQRQPDAVWNLSGRRLLHRFWRGGSRLQDGHWRSLQTIRHVLVEVWCSKHPRPALHSQQQPLG
jgi:hypothetical protein